jgi:ABC-2 type transport system ATP-binding protein
VFLNSHLLGEVEATCDRVAFVKMGRVVHTMPLAATTACLDVELRIEPVQAAVLDGLTQFGSGVTCTAPNVVHMQIGDEQMLPSIASWLVARGVRIYAMHGRRKSLEEWFVEVMGEDQRPG